MSPENLLQQLPRRSPLQIQRAVVLALLIRELRVRVGGRWLGLVWMVFEPLAHTLSILALFGYIRHSLSLTIDYPVFLASGLLPYFMFRNLVKRLTDAVDANRGLFSYRQVKPIDPLVARAIVELFLWGAVCVFTLAALGAAGLHAMPQDPLALLGVLLVLVALGAGAGLLCAVATHERPRARATVNMLFLPLYVASGVVFPLHAVPPAYLDWLLFNPVLHLIELGRHEFVAAYRPLPDANLAYPAFVALVLTAWGMSLYRLKRFQLLSAN